MSVSTAPRVLLLPALLFTIRIKIAESSAGARWTPERVIENVGLEKDDRKGADSVLA
jgi:hypothetical protein